MGARFSVPADEDEKAGAIFSDEANDERVDWRKLPNDLMIEIIKRLDVTDRMMLSGVCKSWSRLAMQKNIPVHQFPLLMLPHHINCTHIRFFDACRSLMYRYNLPKSIVRRKGWCFGSSKGWLLIATKEKYNDGPEISMLNPVSGQIIELPPIDEFEASFSSVRECVTGLELFFLSEDDCIVSAIFNNKILAICRAGDEDWTTVSEAEDGVFIYDDFCFFDGILYVLRIFYGNDEEEDDDMVLPVSLELSEFCGITIKPIDDYLFRHRLAVEVVEANGFNVFKQTAMSVYLVQCDGELFRVDRIFDIFTQDDDDDDEDDDDDDASFDYMKTTKFVIYKIKDGRISSDECKLKNDQIIFLDGGAPSLSVKYFKEGVKGNYIYFLDDHCADPSSKILPFVTHDSGICCLDDDGRITRCFPTVDFPDHMSWFTPQII
ncbi:uncharacterized protein LOC126673290 [Mercurialis annua]|uniref:uncharacterized protein LOC126673290 n=1 Tax=Mercurialis annua TaxID=3986 RepID=UPI00215EEF3C|nr:uncharacterized protein LOC126673290 [Mercurialis annua]